MSLLTRINSRIPKILSRRYNQKYECPVYIYKPSSRAMDVSDGNPTNAFFRTLFIDAFYLSTLDSEKPWIEKNVCIVCELPTNMHDAPEP